MNDSDVMRGGEVALLDHRVFAQLREEIGTARMAPALLAFVSELRARAVRMQQALQAENVALLSRELHSLKGSAGTFGAMRLARMARFADEACKSGDSALVLDQTQRILEQVEPTLDAVRELQRIEQENPVQ